MSGHLLYRLRKVVIAKTIEEYLAALPTDQREVLERLHTVIVSAVPDPKEAIKTGVPAIRYRGKTVVGFGATQKHISLYVMYGEALEVLKEDLLPYETSNTVIRFSSDRPLPASLVRKVVAMRIKEIDAQSSPP